MIKDTSLVKGIIATILQIFKKKKKTIALLKQQQYFLYTL